MKHRLHKLYRTTERLKRKFSNRFTTSGKHFLLVCCVALFFGANVQKTMIYQIFALVFCLLLFSFFASLRYKSALGVHRNLPATCVAGTKLKYTLRIKNSGSIRQRGVWYRESYAETLPDWQDFNTSREEGEEKRNFFDRTMAYYRWLWLLRLQRKIEGHERELPEIGPNKELEVETELLPLRRGNIHLEGYELTRLDPFGLCKRRIFREEANNLLVLPKLYPVPHLLFDGTRKYQQGGVSAAQSRGDSNDFHSLREYTHGDPVKHIDWKSTARSAKGIVKQYRDEYFSRYGLVLDSFTAKRYSRVFEEAVSIAASILVSGQSEHSIFDLLFVGKSCVIRSMGDGLADRRHMMEILASVPACCDKRFKELAGLVKSHSVLLSGIIVILIDLDQERRELMNYLVGLQIPVKGILVVEDIERFENERGREKLNFPLSVIDYRHVEEQIALL